MISLELLAKMMECGRLEPYSNKNEIIKLCDQAKEYNFGIVYANLSYIPLIVGELKYTKILFSGASRRRNLVI